MKKLVWDYDCWTSQRNFSGFSGAATVFEDEYEYDKKRILSSLAATIDKIVKKYGAGRICLVIDIDEEK